MINFILIVIGAIQAYFLFKILGELQVIAADPKSREDIERMLDVLVQTHTPKEKKKIVAFKVKEKKYDSD